MKRVLVVLAVIAVACCLSLAGESGEESMGLAVGDTAPAFTLPGSDGKTHTLKELVAEKAVVIAWFPKAFTGG